MVANEDEEEVMDKDKDVVGGQMKTTTINPKEDRETQQGVVHKATQDQSMINQTLNAIIVRSLAITYLNVELLAIKELKRRQTTLKKEIKNVAPC